MYKSLLNTIMADTLTVDQSYSIGQYILSGDATEIEIASLLTALTFKDESFELIAGFAQALRLYSMKMIPTSKALIDVCGTGGDGSNTFNISTTVSLLLATRMKVSKHGNRSISSRSGSADVLNALKIPKPDTAEMIDKLLTEKNYSFLYAPYMHPHMKYVMPVRIALKIPTIFNIIGPLCNPYTLKYQIIGVYKETLLIPMAKALMHLGIQNGAVIHGHNGLDELSISGVNKVVYIHNNRITEDTIDPKNFGIPYQSLEDIAGGTASINAEITKKVLSGEKGPKQDIVALNAGLGFFIGEEVSSLSDGIKLAYQLLNNKKGLDVLISLKERVI
ncbi:MAG: anthranilate phosphoribosyltransferase [Clostridiales bacterium]|nr:anthranilate phosphoribosyltransferase [Clostridiales bacterium]